MIQAALLFESCVMNLYVFCILRAYGYEGMREEDMRRLKRSNLNSSVCDSEAEVKYKEVDGQLLAYVEPEFTVSGLSSTDRDDSESLQ